MIQEVVGLRLKGVGTDRDDGIGQFRVFVAVVELAHAHVARGVDLGIVGRTIVDPDVLDLHRSEVELAGAPGVFVAAARAPVVECGNEQAILALIVDDCDGDARDEIERVRPTGWLHQ